MEGILRFKMGWAKQCSPEQLKTANPNSPWAFIRKSLLSEGFLYLRFRGLTFGGREGLLSEFYSILYHVARFDRSLARENIWRNL